MFKEDREIIQEVLRGNPNAFSAIIDRYKDKGMTLAFRMLNNREDSEEALQDAFMRAFKALPKFEWKSSFSTWFYRILYNVCLTKAERNKIKYHEDIEEINETEILSNDNSLDTENILESADFKETLISELDKLDPIYRTILTLFYIQEQTYNEIIEITGLPIGTIKNRLFRARNILRESILKHYNEIPVE